MRVMVFRMGEAFAAVPRQDGVPSGYLPDQLRTIALRDGEDELQAVQMYMSNDHLLGEYLGVADPTAFPGSDEFYNARRCTSAYSPDPQRNVGNRLAIGIDMAHARDIRLQNLLDRRDVLVRMERDKGKKQRLSNLDDALAALVAAAKSEQELKATTHPDLQ